MYTLLYVHWHSCQFQGFCFTISPFKICHILYFSYENEPKVCINDVEKTSQIKFFRQNFSLKYLFIFADFWSSNPKIGKSDWFVCSRSIYILCVPNGSYDMKLNENIALIIVYTFLDENFFCWKIGKITFSFFSYVHKHLHVEFASDHPVVCRVSPNSKIAVFQNHHFKVKFKNSLSYIL